jgi:hypothetical protein
VGIRNRLEELGECPSKSRNKTNAGKPKPEYFLESNRHIYEVKASK